MKPHRRLSPKESRTINNGEVIIYIYKAIICNELIGEINNDGKSDG
jgi:hypothetical protein